MIIVMMVGARAHTHPNIKCILSVQSIHSATITCNICELSCVRRRRWRWRQQWRRQWQPTNIKCHTIHTAIQLYSNINNNMTTITTNDIRIWLVIIKPWPWLLIKNVLPFRCSNSFYLRYPWMLFFLQNSAIPLWIFLDNTRIVWCDHMECYLITPSSSQLANNEARLCTWKYSYANNRFIIVSCHKSRLNSACLLLFHFV